MVMAEGKQEDQERSFAYFSETFEARSISIWLQAHLWDRVNLDCPVGEPLPKNELDERLHP